VIWRRAISLKQTDNSDVSTASIICTSETSIYFNETTWRYITEGCLLRVQEVEPEPFSSVTTIITEIQRVPLNVEPSRLHAAAAENDLPRNESAAM
jgi:hypothetical protein